MCGGTRKTRSGRAQKRVRRHVNRGNGDTHRGEGCDFFDSLFVIGDLVPRCSLLAEPKYPTEMHSTRPRNQYTRKQTIDVTKAYVFLRGCTAAADGFKPAFLACAGSGSRFAKEVEK